MAWLLTWLVHGLAIALVTRFALRTLPGLSAATRYAMWWAALVLVLILPIVRGLTINAGSDAGAGAGAAPARAVAVAAAAAEAASPSQSPAPSSPSPAASASSQSDLASVMTWLRSYSLPPLSLPRVPDWFLSIVIGLWLGSAMVGLTQIAHSVQAVRRLKSSCRRMVMPREADLPMWSAVRDLGRAVNVRASDRVRTAAVLGLTRPVIAVPRDAGEALTPHEIDQVVLHEYAHVQRYDDWTKLLQVLIGAFAGWHPAVRLMLREIDFEREAACDDYVVDVTGAPRAYARCLTKVIETMPGAGLDLAAVPHAWSSSCGATTRIERLLDRKRPAGRFAMMPAMAGTVTLAVLAFCTVHALPIATDLPRVHESEALARGGVTLASAELGDAASAARTDADAADAAAAIRDENADVVADDSRAMSKQAAAQRIQNLRIVSASTLPFELPFARFSPLSRLTTDTRVAASGTTLPVAAVPTPVAAPARVEAPPSAASASTSGVAPAAISPSNASPSTASPSTALTRADKPVDVHSTPHAPSRPRDTRDARDLRGAAAPHAEATFALGPVVAAGDSDAMPEASESGHIGRAWESTRDTTSKVMGVSARAVGSATKTAGDATKTATNRAAAGMKAGGTHTARALGRVKRKLASVF